MAFEPSAVRLWKRLGPEERQTAAAAFWSEPPQEMLGSALGLLVKVRHMRPQAVRTLAPETRARMLAGVSDPGEALAAALLVALHLGARRDVLRAFLDELGLPHDDGILKDDEAVPPAPIGEDAARAAVGALRPRYGRGQVDVYLNTLWLQDPERWGVLERSPDWE